MLMIMMTERITGASMIACLVFYYYFWTGLHISQGYQMVATAKLLLDKCDGMSAAHGPRVSGGIFDMNTWLTRIGKRQDIGPGSHQVDLD